MDAWERFKHDGIRALQARADAVQKARLDCVAAEEAIRARMEADIAKARAKRDAQIQKAKDACDAAEQRAFDRLFDSGQYDSDKAAAIRAGFICDPAFNIEDARS